MSDFRKHLERSLRDLKFKAEWDAQAAERDVMRRRDVAYCPEKTTDVMDEVASKKSSVLPSSLSHPLVTFSAASNEIRKQKHWR